MNASVAPIAVAKSVFVSTDDVSVEFPKIKQTGFWKKLVTRASKSKGFKY